jgi:hypothetical protein
MSIICMQLALANIFIKKFTIYKKTKSWNAQFSLLSCLLLTFSMMYLFANAKFEKLSYQIGNMFCRNEKKLPLGWSKQKTTAYLKGKNPKRKKNCHVVVWILYNLQLFICNLRDTSSPAVAALWNSALKKCLPGSPTLSWFNKNWPEFLYK